MRKVLLTTASSIALLFGASAASAQLGTPEQAPNTVAQAERATTPETAPGAGAIEREQDRPEAAGGAAAATPGDRTFLSFEQNEELFTGKVVGDMPAEEWIGRDVVNPEGETIGTIDDLLIQDQEITHALVEVGGFLGIGATRVALDIDELRPAEGAEGDAVTNMTREQLEAMPHLERTNGSWVPSEGTGFGTTR